MKRMLTLLFILLVVLATGCDRTTTPPPAPEQPTQSTEQGTTPVQPAPDSSAVIGEDRAKEIALERAGITEDGVRFDRIELDRDDDFLEYEIEFHQGTTEYEIEIKADDGTVLSFDKDYRD